MSDSDKQRIANKVIAWAVLAAALFFVYRITYAGILAISYPRELLEASNVALTREFLSGHSPYTLASLGRTVPGANYDYPFLASLLAAAIAKITGCGAVTAHFAISYASIILSGLIGYFTVKRFSVTTIAPALAAVMFMFCHWRFGYISAAPDDLGLLLLLSTSAAATSPKIRNKPLICALGITLGFYTKQYFVFVAPGIFIYMFLYSKKDAIKLFAWTLSINAALAIVITLNWPLYWTRAFLFTYIGTAVGGGGELITFLEQFKYLAIAFAALFIIILIAAAMSLRKLYRSNKRLQDIRVCENDPFALSCVQSVVMLAPLIAIGRNDGAFISYFLQLWMPYITVVALVCFERMKTEKYELVYTGIYAAIAAFTIYLGFGKLPNHAITQDEIANWKKAEVYIDKYSETGEVYYSRCLAYEYFDRENGDCFCGHDSEVSEYTESLLKNAGYDVAPDSYLYRLVDQNLAFREDAARKVADHTYSLITLDDSQAFIAFDEDYVIQNGYKCIDKIPLQLGNMPYELSFYAR